MVMDSRGALAKSQATLMRRQQDKEEPSTAALLSQGAASEATQPDMFVLVGRKKCDGGGLWKRYELTTVVPGRYEYCAAACSAKDECVGFDVGATGCNLFTSKAVALGTWPSVKFNNAAPFAGQGDHDAFPQSPLDLTAGTDDNEVFQCFRKTYYSPPTSYFWLIGTGTCSGGGLWKRYQVSPGDKASCENACNQRDECIGFDVGTWSVTDNTQQVNQDNFVTNLVTTTGCNMYTQKAVYGTWPLVQDGPGLLDGEGEHNKFPATPFELQTGHVAKYEVGDHSSNETKCFGKTHWVSLDQYYMLLGNDLCDGDGTWKHYKLAGASLDDCKYKCDMRDECVGLDHCDSDKGTCTEGTMCRLYTHEAIPVSTNWPGAGTSVSAGTGNHDKYPLTPFLLTTNQVASDSTDYSKHCFAKTHFETPDQPEADADLR